MSRCTIIQADIINEVLTMVHGVRKQVKMNKPISVGFVVLEHSKLIIYKFYYEYLKPEYGDKCKLLFTDMDLFCCHIKKNDLYEDMKKKIASVRHEQLLTYAPALLQTNKRVLGKFKSETWSVPPREFVGLQAKMYSLHVPNEKKQTKSRAKAVKKSDVQKQVRHGQFCDVLKSQKSRNSRFRTFRSVNDVLHTLEIHKRRLNAFDDKRNVIKDGVERLAYGHVHIDVIIMRVRLVCDEWNFIDFVYMFDFDRVWIVVW